MTKNKFENQVAQIKALELIDDKCLDKFPNIYILKINYNGSIRVKILDFIIKNKFKFSTIKEDPKNLQIYADMSVTDSWKTLVRLTTLDSAIVLELEEENKVIKVY